MSSKYVYNGFYFQKNLEKDGKIYYKCSRYKVDKCKARLIVSNHECISKGNHTCNQQLTTRTQMTDDFISPEHFIEDFIQTNANDLSLYPNIIYQNLLVNLRSQYQNIPYKIPSKSSTYMKIREIRGAVNLNSILTIMNPPYNIKKNGQPFFRRFWCGDVHGEYHKIIIWCTNECLSLMRYNSHTFVDATFRSTPAPFYQCLIIMVHDIGTNLYIPCVFALMTGRKEHLYSIVFHEIIFLMEFQWMPKFITCDFEKGLLKALKYEFPDSKISGCYFHLKQAIFKKLKKINISHENFNIILTKIELLTLIDCQDINLGIQFIKESTVPEFELTNFWNYFEHTWIKKFDSSIWNISNIKSNEDFKNRTNNPIERYNRRMNENFMNAHPNLCSFAETIKKEFQYFEERCKEVRENFTGIQYEHPNNEIPNILSDFLKYKQISK